MCSLHFWTVGQGRLCGQSLKLIFSYFKNKNSVANSCNQLNQDGLRSPTRNGSLAIVQSWPVYRSAMTPAMQAKACCSMSIAKRKNFDHVSDIVSEGLAINSSKTGLVASLWTKDHRLLSRKPPNIPALAQSGIALRNITILLPCFNDDVSYKQLLRLVCFSKQKRRKCWEKWNHMVFEDLEFLWPSIRVKVFGFASAKVFGFQTKKT